MQLLLVNPPSGCTVERARAEATRVRLNGGMFVQMRLHARLSGERLLADAASELASSVSHLMSLQGRRLKKYLVAVIAFVARLRMAAFRVQHQLISLLESFRTPGAMIRQLAVVDALVDDQILGVRKALSALVATVRQFTGVHSEVNG